MKTKLPIVVSFELPAVGLAYSSSVYKPDWFCFGSIGLLIVMGIILLGFSTDFFEIRSGLMKAKHFPLDSLHTRVSCFFEKALN